MVTADLWPDDPNYEITYTAESRCPGVVGAVDHVTPLTFICQRCRNEDHVRCGGCDCQHRERRMSDEECAALLDVIAYDSREGVDDESLRWTWSQPTSANSQVTIDFARLVLDGRG